MDGWAEEWLVYVWSVCEVWVGLRVGFSNISDMYNNEVLFDYFTIEWSKAAGAFTVRDSLASRTKAAHKEAMVLLWAILLASARADNTLWLHEPVLVLSEDQVLREFRELLLDCPGHKG